MARSNFIVRGGADFSAINRAMQQTQRQMGAFQASINGSMGMISKGIKLALGYVSLRAIAGFVKATTDAASDLTEVQNVVDVTFNEMAESINKFAKTSIEQFGLSELSAKKYASTMGAMLKSSGIGGKTMRDMSVKLTALAADMASFYNLDTDVAFQKIMSGMSGMTQPLKELGINMNIANLQAFALSQGITKSWKSMSQAEQTMIRYQYLLSVTGDAQGDFARNSQTWANQTRILAQQFEGLKATIGQGFINVLLPVIKALNTLIKYIQIAAEYFKAFTAMIFGKATVGGKGANIGGILNDVGAGAGGIGETADALEDVEEGLDGVGGAGKKASKNLKGVLADFDEVHTLANKTADTGGGAGGIGGVGAVDFGELSTGEIDFTPNMEKLEKFQQAWEKTKQLLNEGFNVGFASANLDSLRAAIDKLKESFNSLFSDGQIAEAFNNMIGKWVQSLGQIVGAIASIATTIATNLIGGIAEYIETNKQFIKDRILSIFNLSGEIAEKIANIFTDLADIFSVFAGETAQKVTSNIIGIFTNAFLGLTELVMRVINSILGVIEKVINDNKEKIKTAIENTLKPIEKVTQAIEDFIVNTFEKIFEVYDKYIQPAFDNIAEGLSKLVGTILDAYNNYIAPVFSEWAEKFDKLFKEHIQPMVNSAIEFFGKLALAISELFNNVIVPVAQEVIERIGPAVKVILQTIGDVVEVVLKIIVNAIKMVFDSLSGLIEFLTAVFKGDWESAWKSIQASYENFKESAGKISGAIKDFFSNLADHIGGFFKERFSQAVEESRAKFASFKENILTQITGIKTKFTEIASYLSGAFKSAWTNTWDAIGRKVNDISTSIKNGVRNAINGIIDHINGLIGKLNRLSFKIPDFLGGGTVGFSIPTIPKLAKGGIIDRPTTALIGEAGPEMVVPLENTSFVDKLASALGNAVMSAMQVSMSTGSSGGQIGNPILEIDGVQFGRIIYPHIERERQRLGVDLA